MQLNQISEHVYWLPPDETTDRPVLGVIVGKVGSLIVDAGNSPAHANLLLSELTNHKLPDPKYLVLTHWHWDHVFGTSVFNVPIIAQRETKRIVEEMARLDWSDEALDERVKAGTETEFCRDMMKLELPDRSNLKLIPPDISFVRQLEIDLGTVTCRVEHIGGDHSADSCVVHIPEDSITFLSDCLYMDIYSKEGTYTTKKLFPLVDQLLSYEAGFYLLGHDPAPRPYAEMAEYCALLKTIGQTVNRLGLNRDQMMLHLKEALGKTLDDDDLEIVDAFMAGLDTIP